MESTQPQLTAKLEAMLLRALVAEWKGLNDLRFRGRMQLPSIALTDATSVYGRWIARGRSLDLSRAFVLGDSWGAVIEVLKHEMAHQFVDEVLDIHDETAHGHTFQKVCEELGIDARAKGVPDARSEGDQRVAARIAKLLALAESPNLHEAETAMVAAQRLMLKYNIEASALGGAKAYGFRHVGEPTGRVQEHERVLAALLQAYFFVDAIWVPVYRPLLGKRASVLELCGSPTNLDIAEYVHGFLLAASERLWRKHKADQGIHADRDRRVFLSGVFAGFSEKLRAERTVLKGEGLVWIKDGAQETYFRRRYPRVRYVSYQGQRKTSAYDEGREAGKKLVLHKGVRGGAAARGHLLK